jgi:hypothetical protein
MSEFHEPTPISDFFGWKKATRLEKRMVKTSNDIHHIQP